MARGKPKKAKRDPLTQSPLPQAGDSTYKRWNDLLTDKVFMWIVAIVIFVTAAINEWWTQRPPAPIFMTACALVVVIVGIVRIRTAFRQGHNLRLGFRGERVVGQLLEGMRSEGYYVFHDIAGGNFNVDHVLVGPAGVFVIETKTISKPAKGPPTITYDGQCVVADGKSFERDPIVQARACRDHIRKIIAQTTDIKPKMRGVVLFPGWFVERQPKGVEVWVLNPAAFLAFVGQEPHVQSDDQTKLIAMTIATHIRSTG